MKFENFEKIMEFAIEKEREAVRFYEELSSQEAYSAGKERFLEFAAEERKHEEMLRHFTKENLKSYESEPVPDLRRSDYIVDFNYSPGLPFSDVLILAAKREEKALALYSALAEKAEIEEHKKLFEFLAGEEAKHKFALESILDDHMAEIGD
jgi:rubrerythrin